jgi:hypothetical protein
MQMNKDYLEKFDVIRRYHQHRLTDEELNSFEVYILENPEIINVIEQEKVIHDAFREHAPLLKEDIAGTSSVPWGRGLAMAACLLVAVVAVFNYTGNQPSFSVQPPVILETFRGAGDNTVQVNGQPIVQFQIDMGPAELLRTNAFTAELADADGNVTYRVTGLSADADGWLFYTLEGQDAVLLGTHEVRVYPDGSPVQAASYAVTFSAP